MIFHWIISVFIYILPVETCFPTIAPEEYYPTSPLPPYQPSTKIPVTGVPGSPGTDAPVTDTPVNECTTCDITDIAPTTNPSGTTFETMDSTDASGCKQSIVTCKRTDNQVCSLVSITSGTTTLASSTGTDNSATASLKCATDGTWSSGATTNIGQLTCNYNCMPPTMCSGCDITAIAPTGLPAGEVFENMDSTDASGCKQSVATCKRTDDQVCTSVTLSTTTGTIATSTGTDTEVSATLQCQADGTWSSGATTNIGQLACTFNCMPPSMCTTCDIAAIAPTGLQTGEAFETMDSIDVSGCKQTEVTCKRTDDQICTSVTITSGSTTLAISSGTNTFVTATLLCDTDGTWSSGATTNIGQLTCNYICMPPPPCTTCMAPPVNLPAGYTFTAVDSIVDGCKQTTVTCTRNAGGASCDIRLYIIDVDEDIVSIPPINPLDGFVSRVLTCNDDGTYRFPTLSRQYVKFDCYFGC